MSDNFDDPLGQLQERIDQLVNELESLKAVYSQACFDRDGYKTKLDEAQGEIETLKEDRDRVQNKLDEAETALQEIKDLAAAAWRAI